MRDRIHVTVQRPRNGLTEGLSLGPGKSSGSAPDFVEAAGDVNAAGELLKGAREQREPHQTLTIKATQQRGQPMME
jgi:hypothetical protein